MNTTQCPRCHAAGAMLEERALFPQTRTCGVCEEHQRRCQGCYRWFPEHELTVIDHAATCDDCQAMERDSAERDRWELVTLAKNLTLAWRF